MEIRNERKKRAGGAGGVLVLLLAMVWGQPLAGAGATEARPRLVSNRWMSLAQWYRFHAEDVEVAEAGGVNVLWLGDSITEGWKGQAVWEERIAPLGSANFGIGGDTTSEVLWRLRHGAAGKLDPQVVVLLIGTNNFHFNGDAPSEVVGGVAAVLGELQARFPRARVLLLGLFPREENPAGETRRKVAAVNRGLPGLADGERVVYRDLGPLFLEADGRISPEVMPDFLHLSAEGYRRWAEGVLPLVESWLNEAGK